MQGYEMHVKAHMQENKMQRKVHMCHTGLTLFRQVTVLRRRFFGSSWLALQTKENYSMKWKFIQPQAGPHPTTVRSDLKSRLPSVPAARLSFMTICRGMQCNARQKAFAEACNIMHSKVHMQEQCNAMHSKSI